MYQPVSKITVYLTVDIDGFGFSLKILRIFFSFFSRVETPLKITLIPYSSTLEPGFMATSWLHHIVWVTSHLQKWCPLTRNRNVAGHNTPISLFLVLMDVYNQL